MFMIIINGTNVGTVYALSKSDFTVIGRGEECDICILDLMISRMHCQIAWKKENFYIKDLNSTNKTYINKRIIEGEEKLEPRDTIYIGNTTALFTDKEEIPIKNIEGYKIIRMGKTRLIDSKS